MTIPRRSFLQLAAGVAALLTLPQSASAQAYPARPVRIIVGLAAGGGASILAQLVAQSLSERLGQPFVIENRPGAGTNIATETVVEAPPDGYTLLMALSPNAINATLYPKLKFDFIRDIAPVGGIARTPLVMEVNPAFPAKTVPEFIAYAKANPGTINMASAGNGNSGHVAGELFKMMTGIDMVHVPYRGGAPAIEDLLGGQVQVLFDPIISSVSLIKTGKLRALAMTSASRSPTLPDVPAMGEFVPGYEASGFFGLGAPARTPPEIIGKLNAALNASLADPRFQTRLADLGGASLAGSPAEFGKLIADETEKWRKVIKFAGIKLE